MENRFIKEKLSLIILKDGTIEEAIPSHIKKLEEIFWKQSGMSYRKFISYLKNEKYDDYLTFLLNKTKAVALWEEFNKGKRSVKQTKVLTELKEKGLYKGEI